MREDVIEIDRGGIFDPVAKVRGWIDGCLFERSRQLLILRRDHDRSIALQATVFKQ